MQLVQAALDKGLLQPQRVSSPIRSRRAYSDSVERIATASLNNRLNNNDKLDKARGLSDKLQLDGMMHVEHRLNLKHKDNMNSFKQMFQREDVVKAVCAQNVHWPVGRVQEGGTAMVAFGTTMAYNKRPVKDPTGLGRWSGFRYCGSHGNSTIVVSDYNPCKNKKVEPNTTYQQHRWYFIEKQEDLRCPSILFRRDLLRQLQEWKAEGNKIILFMDHNKDIYSGHLGKMIAGDDKLKMKEEGSGIGLYG